VRPGFAGFINLQEPVCGDRRYAPGSVSGSRAGANGNIAACVETEPIVATKDRCVLFSHVQVRDRFR
jgi:hypothetical protein